MKKIFSVLLFFIIFQTGFSQIFGTNYEISDLNKLERLDWFRELGFGMFVHFSIDSQLGIVISHSMAGASHDYLERYVNELPKTFNPKDYNPEEIANLAKLAGMKYIVFTAKHHSGFCMWDTQTTDFNITNTPYKEDIISKYVEATREAGLAVGLYYSPEDFNFLYENNLEVKRSFTKPIPNNVMKNYLELVELQCMELMAKFGEIDLIFFDGGEGPLQEKCKQVVWELQPNIVVTRGAIQTPEQTLLGISSSKPWESCITMGTQWAYKPTNEDYKSGARLIEILIETRAKGGNLLLNVGPKPNGELPEKQEENLREMAAWNFINGESVENVNPWILPNEKNIWFTWKPSEKTLFAFLTKIPDWERGDRKEFVLKSVKITHETEVEILGQSGELVEYQPKTDAQTYFEEKEGGLYISCVRAQRIYNNHKWNNPVVIKLKNVEPALVPPTVVTKNSNVTEMSNTSQLEFIGEILEMGDTEKLNVGFQIREYQGFIDELNSGDWSDTRSVEITAPREYIIKSSLRKTGKEYQIRAFAEHPKLKIYGDIKRVFF